MISLGDEMMHDTLHHRGQVLSEPLPDPLSERNIINILYLYYVYKRNKLNYISVLHCRGQVLSDRLLAYSDLVTGFLALKGDLLCIIN